MSESETGPDSEVTVRVAKSWRRRARRVWLVARVVVVLAVVAVGAWWLTLSPVPVTTHVVAVGSVNAEVLGTGTLEARVGATVGPKMAGLITRVTVDQGDRVNAGDTLVYLEDTDYKQQVGIAEADVAAAMAAIDRLHADQRRADAVLTQANLTHERQVQAAAASASSQQELDETAEALAIAEAELARTVAAITEGRKRLAAAERLLDYQKARLADTTIEAPFDALVVRRDRDAGDVVTAGSSVLRLASLDEMWITAWVDETELSRLAEDQTVRVVFRSEPLVEYPGVVARLGRETDRETREIVVDVRVDRLPDTWAIGQRAEVYIGVDQRENVTVIPAGLLLRREGRTGVMVNEGGKARWRTVVVGLHGRENIEIMDGLEPGDVVVSPAAASGGELTDGRRIAVK
ncbi:MAG: efflux RND transporter periplasmic adaptor subunit [Phycisphaerales bacterium]|nr:efflux RND transporter periplasmic adaptor subunit [Phycisphaerales bacterium]